MNTERIKDELLRLKRSEDEQTKRAANPNGLNRLAALVPECAPDQVSLARALATIAYESRKRDFEPGATSIKVDEKFRETEPATLAREARQCKVAWAACELWMNPQSRSRIERTADGQARKVIKPIPDPILKLMEECFTGEEQCRHGYDDNTARYDAIRFMVWCALEADINATSRAAMASAKSETEKPTACGIVASLIGEEVGNVALIWQGRKHKKRRASKYA